MMDLAREGKFEEILACLTSASAAATFDESNDTTTIHSSPLPVLYITNPEESAFPLHAILKYRPPASVVNALVHVLQQGSQQEDNTKDGDDNNNNDATRNTPASSPSRLFALTPKHGGGGGILVPEEMRERVLQQTPLHVAVASGCSLPVIARLLQGESLVLPAMTKDGLHRFPLHWACCGRRLNGNGGRRNGGGSSAVAAVAAAPTTLLRHSWLPISGREIDYRWDLIHFLLEQYPVAVVIPDLYHQTPLDYARHYKLHISIIDLLEYAYKEYAHYAPKQYYNNATKLSSSFKEHTEGTTEVSDSDHFLLPDEMPILITSSPTTTSYSASADQQQKQQFSWASDDVSSLGGDYSYCAADHHHHHRDGLLSPPTSSSLGAAVVLNPMITQVTSLLSSAFAFGTPTKASLDEEEHEAPFATTNSTTTTQLADRQAVPLEEEGDQPQVSSPGSGQLFFKDKRSETSSSGSGSSDCIVDDDEATSRDTNTATQGACVRAVSLLRGNMPNIIEHSETAALTMDPEYDEAKLLGHPAAKHEYARTASF